MDKKAFYGLLIAVAALYIVVIINVAFDWSSQWTMAEQRDRIEALEMQNDKLRLDLKASDEAIDTLWQSINDMDDQVTRCILECGGPE
jgi:peptidoglycan hydrolase CwlO-like protein